MTYAAKQGAQVIEGYPVDTGGRRRPSAELYTGTLDLFTRAGFTEAFRRSPRRPVVRFEVMSAESRAKQRHSP